MPVTGRYMALLRLIVERYKELSTGWCGEGIVFTPALFGDRSLKASVPLISWSASAQSELLEGLEVLLLRNYSSDRELTVSLRSFISYKKAGNVSLLELAFDKGRGYLFDCLERAIELHQGGSKFACELGVDDEKLSAWGRTLDSQTIEAELRSAYAAIVNLESSIASLRSAPIPDSSSDEEDSGEEEDIEAVKARMKAKLRKTSAALHEKTVECDRQTQQLAALKAEIAVLQEANAALLRARGEQDARITRLEASLQQLEATQSKPSIPAKPVSSSSAPLSGMFCSTFLRAHSAQQPKELTGTNPPMNPQGGLSKK